MLTLALLAQLLGAIGSPDTSSAAGQVISMSQAAPGDWPQLAHDAQRTNYTPLQVDPPYCYIWKWYEVPFASRAQPVVAAGRLFIGGMDGVLYARNAATGASLWTFPGDGSPIRHSAGVMSDTVVFSTHAGTTFALRAADGALRWQRVTGPSATAPLLDAARGYVVVASTDGRLTALRLSDGSRVWEHRSDAPIITTPALSPITLYAVWLWAKNTGNWTIVRDNWSALTALYNAHREDLPYYADFAGLISYARMARHLFGTTALTYTQAVDAAVAALQAGRVITPYITYAKSITQYWTPRDDQSEWTSFEGWYLPVFYGLTPEIGLYLREQTGGLAVAHVLSRETGDGLRWWYLTRAGIHAEEGESSYVAPQAAWAHFLAHAYILGDHGESLRRWLDRPWGRGDLYSIQKIVATLQATGRHSVYLPMVLRNPML